MKNIKNKKNKQKLSSPKKLNLILESNKKSSSSQGIKLGIKSPISLNIKNIKDLKNENKQFTRRVNSFDTSLLKNKNLLFQTFDKKHLIIKHNSIFKTIDGTSNSDNSFSSTYNSSRKTHILSEQNVRKYILNNENILFSDKFNNRHHKKNSIFGKIIESTFLNEKKDLSKISTINNNSNNKFFNHHFTHISSLTERNSFNNTFNIINNSKNEINHLSRNKNTSPIKLLSNTSSSNHSDSNKKVISLKTFVINKNKCDLNIIRPKTSKTINRPLIRNNTVLKDLKRKKFSDIINNNKIKTYFKQRNFNLQKEKRISLLKSKTKFFKSKLTSEMNIYNVKIKKINSYSDNEILKNKIPTNKKIKKKLLSKRKSISNLKPISNKFSLPKIAKLSNKSSFHNNKLLSPKKTFINKLNDQEKKKTNKPIKINEITRTFNLFFNTYNTCSETESEKSNIDEESINSIKNKKHSIILLEKNEIKEFFHSPRKLSDGLNLIIKHHHHKYKNKFEKNILEKLDNIEKKSLEKKINIIHNFQKENLHILCTYEKNIENLEKKNKKKYKSKISIMKTLTIDLKLFHITSKFDKIYLKRMLKIRNRYKSLNKYYINSYLLSNYFPIYIYEEIYYQKYLNTKIERTNIESFYNNFKSDKNNFLLRKGNLEAKSSTLFEIKQIISSNYFKKKDFLLISNFYRLDNEYHINTKIKKFSFQFEKLKTRIIYPFNKLIFNETTTRRKKTKILDHNTFKDKLRKSKSNSSFGTSKSIQKEKKEEEREKKYLINALKKIDFFSKKVKKTKRLYNQRKLYSKSITKSQKEKELEKMQILNNNGVVNNLQMISRVSDLKMKMLQNLELSEILFFHIKDRNYSQFKQLFEKYKMNPDTIDSNGNSFLSLAVQSNCFQIVNYLLNIGANVNTQNNSNNTPLHFALSFHNFEIADMLIQRGADEKILNKYGMTPWQCLDTGLSII